MEAVGLPHSVERRRRGSTGFAIALSGDGNTLAAGAPMEASRGTGINGKGDDDSAYSSGAVYVYARSGTGWAQQAYLKASNTGSNDQFGNAVALSADGNTLAVSAVFEDSGATGINGNQADNSVEESGAVYVFTRTGTTWTQQAYIKASNTGGRDDGDTFGYTIALSDDGATLAVGAPSEDSSSTGNNANQGDNSAVGAGAVYVFTRAGASWSQQAYVKSPNNRANSLFGYSVALNSNGDTLAAGAFDEDGGKGAVHVFMRKGGAWTEQARLQSSNAERADSFGAWVAISDDGNTVAAGALDEDSLLTNVNQWRSGSDGPVNGYFGRRRLRLHSYRDRMVAAGLHQSLEYGEGRLVRRSRGVERRRKHRGRERPQRRRRQRRRRRKRAPFTCTPGAPAPGAIRWTSRARTPISSMSSAARSL